MENRSHPNESAKRHGASPPMRPRPERCAKPAGATAPAFRLQSSPVLFAGPAPPPFYSPAAALMCRSAAVSGPASPGTPCGAALPKSPDGPGSGVCGVFAPSLGALICRRCRGRFFLSVCPRGKEHRAAGRYSAPGGGILCVDMIIGIRRSPRIRISTAAH